MRHGRRGAGRGGAHGRGTGGVAGDVHRRSGKACQGREPGVEATVVKDMGTSFEQSVPTLIADIVGNAPSLALDPVLYRTLQYVSQICPSIATGSRRFP